MAPNAEDGFDDGLRADAPLAPPRLARLPDVTRACFTRA
jgi:hypothetical protein